MKKEILFLMSVLVLLAGCSGVTSIDCVETDWQEIGLQDGESGTAANPQAYQENCSAEAGRFDMDAYTQAYEIGLRNFCQAENGFEQGSLGTEYTAVCPADLKNAFEEEYKIGAMFYAVTSDMQQLELTIGENSTSIDQLEAGISRAYIQQEDDTLTYAEQNQIRQSIESMLDQVTGLEYNSDRLTSILNIRQGQLQDLKDYYGR